MRSTLNMYEVLSRSGKPDFSLYRLNAEIVLSAFLRNRQSLDVNRLFLERSCHRTQKILMFAFVTMFHCQVIFICEGDEFVRLLV